jgi:2'-5' RNA ligase
MIRLFVAIALPDALRRRLAMLCSGLRDAHWANEENLHLTLRFIGEVQEDRYPDIVGALDRVRVPEFDLILSGAGHFERGKRVHSVWVGVAPNPALMDLQERVDGVITRAGFEGDSRRFVPHVTLARIPGQGAKPDAAAKWLSGVTMFRAPPMAVEQVTLFRSHLGHGGAHYEPVHEVPLLPRPGPGPG